MKISLRNTYLCDCLQKIGKTIRTEKVDVQSYGGSIYDGVTISPSRQLIISTTQEDFFVIQLNVRLGKKLG